MIRAVVITNIFDPLNPANRRIAEEEWSGKSLSSYLPTDYEVIVNMNGVNVDDMSVIVPDNAQLVIAPIIEGGGGGKNVLRTIAMVAVAVSAPYVAGAIIGAAGGALAGAGYYYGITAAITVAGSLIVNSVLPPQMPAMNIPNMSGQETSPTYSWEGMRTMARIGTPIPVLYGRHAIVGNVIHRRVDFVGDDEYLYMLIALCEGEIETLYASNIKLNGMDISNYKNVKWYQRSGTESQSVIPGFGDSVTPNIFSVKCEKDVTQTRGSIGNAIEGLRVYVSFPYGIFYTNDQGKFEPRTIEFKVEYRKVGGQWVTVQEYREDVVSYEYAYGVYDDRYGEVVKGWTSNPNLYLSYPIDYDDLYMFGGRRPVKETTYFNTWKVTGATNNAVKRQIDVDNLALGEYEVRITRLSDNSTEVREKTDMYFSGMGEVIYDDMRYPGVALFGIKIKATDQLSGGDPNFLIEATRKAVRVYDNSGNYKYSRASSNPAWATYDLLTNQKVGGAVPYSQIDLATYEAWGAWCDEFVTNGIGGYKEPRARFNGVFDFQTNIWEAAQKIATVGRAGLLIRGTKYSAIVDKPSEPVHMFNMGNIVKGSYKVEYSGAEDMATEVEVQFTNRENDYARDQLAVIAPSFFDQTVNSNRTTVSQMGITSASQAYRAGKYYLNCNKELRRTVSFEVGVDALPCTVGDVVYFSHDVPMCGNSGRVNGATSTTVTLDQEVTLLEGTNYKLIIRLKDDTFVHRDVSFTGNQVTDTLTVTASFTTIPEQYDIFTFGEEGKEAQLLRIFDISRSGDQTRKVRAMDYNASILSDTETIIPTPRVSSFKQFPHVILYEINEHLEVSKEGLLVPYVDFSWAPDVADDAVLYNLHISKDGGATYILIAENIKRTDHSFNATGLTENQGYLFKIQAGYSLIGYESIDDAITIPYTFFGKSYPPQDVQNFTAKQNGQFVDLRWLHVTDPDLWGYEIRRGLTWEAADVIATGISADMFTFPPELNGSYEYLIKAIDQSGVYSENSTSAYITIKGIDEGLNEVVSGDIVPVHDGTMDNFIYYDAKLVNFTSLRYDDFTSETYETFPSETYEEHFYAEYVSTVLDTSKLGLTTVRLLDTIQTALASPTYADLIDRTYQTYPTDRYDKITAVVDKVISVSYSDDDITYTEWAPYNGVTQEEFRYLKIKYRVDYGVKGTRIELSALKYILDVPDVQYVIENFSVGASGEDILHSTYGQQFYQNVIIRATLLGAGANVTPDITDKTLSGFHIDLYDSNDAKISGNVDLIITGY